MNAEISLPFESGRDAWRFLGSALFTWTFAALSMASFSLEPISLRFPWQWLPWSWQRSSVGPERAG